MLLAPKFSVPLSGGHLQAEHAQKRRLARAAFADDAQNLARGNPETDISNRSNPAALAGGVECPAEVFHLDHRIVFQPHPRFGLARCPSDYAQIWAAAGAIVLNLPGGPQECRRPKSSASAISSSSTSPSVRSSRNS
ncbi:hypothetical protein MIC97_14645 [Aquamicrobium sp. NLF2-7]|uniref:hypothetical protein n=1 Tax=Aquamicrobium sp. NLF2-7 TaxID=2918753 RepID=UPI001EFB3FF9|nr:hypothetical protein [Aquamicrobium sp. NLF2-7]MCG8272737.1 hypothetical protein [Aquamicrobium sp. NLF2-7]